MATALSKTSLNQLAELYTELTRSIDNFAACAEELKANMNDSVGSVFRSEYKAGDIAMTKIEKVIEYLYEAGDGYNALRRTAEAYYNRQMNM